MGSKAEAEVDELNEMFYRFMMTTDLSGFIEDASQNHTPSFRRGALFGIGMTYAEEMEQWEVYEMLTEREDPPVSRKALRNYEQGVALGTLAAKSYLAGMQRNRIPGEQA